MPKFHGLPPKTADEAWQVLRDTQNPNYQYAIAQVRVENAIVIALLDLNERTK